MNVQYLRKEFDIGHAFQVYVHIERNHIVAKLVLLFEKKNDHFYLVSDSEHLERLNMNPDELERVVLTYMKK